jgi:hypothetical protein
MGFQEIMAESKGANHVTIELVPFRLRAGRNKSYYYY